MRIMIITVLCHVTQSRVGWLKSCIISSILSFVFLSSPLKWITDVRWGMMNPCVCLLSFLLWCSQMFSVSGGLRLSSRNIQLSAHRSAIEQFSFNLCAMTETVHMNYHSRAKPVNPCENPLPSLAFKNDRPLKNCL